MTVKKSTWNSLISEVADNFAESIGIEEWIPLYKNNRSKVIEGIKKYLKFDDY